jgi:very-short-patch-repair endonuclease
LIGKTSPHARRLRRDSTDAERVLWQRLRNRQLGGAKFRRQATIGPFVADFLCVEARLIVELDGGHHSDERDAARTAFLDSHGYRLIRFWNSDMLQNRDGVLQAILIALEEEMPSPNPLPRAGEGLETPPLQSGL